MSVVIPALKFPLTNFSFASTIIGTDVTQTFPFQHWGWGIDAVLSAEIIKTAQLELQYSLTVSRLDKQDQGVSPGPLVLTGGAVSNETR